METAAEILGIEEIDYVKLLDISIVKDGTEIQPKVPVYVNIRLTDRNEGKDAPGIVHFGADGPKEIRSDIDDEIITFEAPGFSVYAILETVPLTRSRNILSFCCIKYSSP